MPARLFPRAPTTRIQAQGNRTGCARGAPRSCAGGRGTARSGRPRSPRPRRGGPSATTLPPCTPAPRPHVDDVIGAVDRLFVVLDDDHGVPEVAQAHEGVRADGGCRAGATRSKARRGRTSPRRVPPPIWLASLMRCASPPESVSAARSRERVVEPHVDEEPEPLGDLSEDPARDLRLRAAEVESREEVVRGADRQRRRGRGGSSPPTKTLRADRLSRAPPQASQARVAEVLRELVADHARLRLPVPALHVGEHAFEGLLAGVGLAPLDLEREPDGLRAAPVEDDVAYRGGQLAERVCRCRSRSARQAPGSSGSSRRCADPSRGPPRRAGSARDGRRSGRGRRTCRTPSPSQCWHAPEGLLNEKIRGSSSGIRVAADVAGEAGGEHGVAAGGPVAAVGPVAATGPRHRGRRCRCGQPRPHGRRRPSGATMARPSERRESGLERLGEAQRQVPPGPGSDSTTTSIECFRFGSSAGGSFQLVQHAVDPRPHEPPATSSPR